MDILVLQLLFYGMILQPLQKGLSANITKTANIMASSVLTSVVSYLMSFF